jgi:protein-disulfide isomerase
MSYKKLARLSQWSAVALLACGFTLSARAEVSDKDFAAAMDKYLQTDAGAEKIGNAMEKYFQKKQQDALKQQEQQAQAEMENQFKNPVKLDVGKAPVRGPANAKVTIIEFSDFQCPYCRRGFETMEEIMKAYPNDVKIAFKHYPLPFHKEAEPAAKAAWAAQQQGKFWEFHDALFKNQDKLGTQFYLDTAKELKLDVEKFKKDMASPEASKQIQEDTDLGARNGIQGTPGFFVNGVAVRGAYPASHFKQIIDRWLKGSPAK